MSLRLFRREDGTPMVFDIVLLDEKKTRKLTREVEYYGGKVEHRCDKPKCHILFTENYDYLTELIPETKFFDAQFILDCIDVDAIQHLQSYRIGMPEPDDKIAIQHFLSGSCDCRKRSREQAGGDCVIIDEALNGSPSVSLNSGDDSDENNENTEPVLKKVKEENGSAAKTEIEIAETRRQRREKKEVAESPSPRRKICKSSISSRKIV